MRRERRAAWKRGNRPAGPGIAPHNLAAARDAGITDEEAWQAREQEAFERLAAARCCLDLIESAIAARELPVLSGGMA
jgi:hypothetical protein